MDTMINDKNLKPLLAINVGSENCKAFLFDIVDGKYDFIALGTSPTTTDDVNQGVKKGILKAIDELEAVSVRKVVTDDAQLIVPSRSDGNGVDSLILTYSVGAMLRVVTLGLMEDGSLGNAKRLAQSTYAKIIDSIGLNDGRKPEIKIDAIIKSAADVVLFSGGSDDGASSSISQMADLLYWVCKALPQEKRPEIFYAGNQALVERLSHVFDKMTNTTIASNIRSAVNDDGWLRAQDDFNLCLTQNRYRQYTGLQQFGSLSSTSPMPTAQGFANMIRFLSYVHTPKKSVLGIDLGSSTTTAAMASSGKLALEVFAYGSGYGIRDYLKYLDPASIQRWIPFEITPAEIKDYFFQKSLFPTSIPLTEETFAFEAALVRCMLASSMRAIMDGWHNTHYAFDPIIVTGGFFNNNYDNSKNLMTILDGLQPVGVSTVILDRHGITGSLGAVAKFNSLVPVHLMESNAYETLGTVISPVSKAKLAAPILNIRLEFEDNREERYTIKKGQIVRLPLELGQNARISIQCQRGTRLELNDSRRFRSFNISGGLLGIIIDARGRPIEMPEDNQNRIRMIKQWSESLKNKTTGT